MTKYWIAAALLVGVVAVGAGAFLLGRQHHRGPPGFISLQGAPVIDLGAAVDLAVRQVPGEVLKVELENEDDRFVYEVKVLATNGRVREIKLDAKDGALIEIEDD